MCVYLCYSEKQYVCVSVLFRKTMYECICVLSGKTVRPYWLRLGKCVPASLGGAGGVGAERMKKLWE